MTTAPRLRLGVNIDHVATLRNARGSAYPDPLRAALLAEAAGADGITAHLREDRRHIRDADIAALMGGLTRPLNFEMAATAEMQDIALAHRPHAVCLVPERREERTTEGGLDVAGDEARLTAFIAPLKAAGIRVSLFIGHAPAQIAAAARVGRCGGRTAHRRLLRSASPRAGWPSATLNWRRCGRGRRLRMGRGSRCTRAMG